MQKILINAKLPSLNEVIEKNRTNPYIGAKLKKETQRLIEAYILESRAKRIEEPVEVMIRWHEKDKRRDVDNIQSAAKFILDALQEAGILPTDGRKWVKQVYHKVVDDTKTFVEVYLREVEE